MTKAERTWVILLTVLALILMYTGYKLYVCQIKGVCNDKIAASLVNTQTDDERPLLFNYGKADPIINDSTFQDFLTKKMADMKEGQVLTIEGQYYKGEDEALGDARAEAIKKLFAGKIPEGQFTLKTRQINQEVDQKQLFEAAEMFWTDGSVAEASTDEDKGEDESAEEEGKDDAAGSGDEEGGKIVELKDRTQIYHVFGSAERTVDRTVDEYLEKLVQRLSQTSEKVQLTGHTDNIGSDEDNQKLGKQRADFIKAILIEKGVEANRIITKSAGESEPVESNDTDEGRRKNRRTELLLLR